MEVKKRAERLKDVNEITIAVISDENNLPKDKVFYNYIKDISESGAKIQANILLPVNALLKIDFTLDTPERQVAVIGKVKRINAIIEDNCYEVGVEFVDTPGESIKKITEYISWKQKSTGLNPFGLPFWIYPKTNEPESK